MGNSNAPSNPTALVLLLLAGLYLGDVCSIGAGVCSIRAGVWVCTTGVSVCADICNSCLPGLSVTFCSCRVVPRPPVVPSKFCLPLPSPASCLTPAFSGSLAIAAPAPASCPVDVGESGRTPWPLMPLSWPLLVLLLLRRTQAALWGLQSFRLSVQPCSVSVCSGMPQTDLSLFCFSAKTWPWRKDSNSLRPHKWALSTSPTILTFLSADQALISFRLFWHRSLLSVVMV